MIKRVPYNFNAQKNLDILSKAAFLTTKSGNKINTMVIGWGTIGILWRLPVFNTVVRQNRFTYEQIEESHEYRYDSVCKLAAGCGRMRNQIRARYG